MSLARQGLGPLLLFLVLDLLFLSSVPFLVCSSVTSLCCIFYLPCVWVEERHGFSASLCLHVVCFLGCLTCGFFVVQVLLVLADCPLRGMKVRSFDALFMANHISFFLSVHSCGVFMYDLSLQLVAFFMLPVLEEIEEPV